ncbi:sulfate ABC transporter permease [Vibrio atypicus]|uniref:sulfate ABC transporter permease n=1 Tax=Vibrio atypicus TaxID=558271 RepID=UPI003735C664
MSSIILKNSQLYSLILVLFFVSVPQMSAAQIQLTDDLRLSGFGTFSATKSDNSTPILFNREIDDEWCFDCDTTLGVQLDWQMSANFRGAVQVLKRPQDTFSSPEVERAYLEYSYENLRFKAGRLRVPLYIMSEYYYVSSAYPWLRLPPEIYSNNLGITHYDGVTVDWDVLINDSVQLTVSPYITIPEEEEFELYGAKFSLDTDYAFGISSEFYFDDNLLHIAYSKVKTVQKGLPMGNITYDLNLFSAGMSYYLWQSLRFQAEALLEKSIYANWYAGLDYQIGQFTPYIQYGQARKTKDSQSYLVGVRCDLTRQVNVSLEWQRFTGDKKIISGQFTELQNPLNGFSSKVDLISVGLSYTF